MARKGRLEFPGFYHVIDRGVEKRDIFMDDEDHQAFLEIIEESADTFSIKVHSFCLMDNHYHLLINTKDENLSVFMIQINARKWGRGYFLRMIHDDNQVRTLDQHQCMYKSWMFGMSKLRCPSIAFQNVCYNYSWQK